MKYHLRVYDNYHYMDESEAYDHGHYASYEEAERAAKDIVDDFLRQHWERGIQPGMLVGLYIMNGEDPVVLPADRQEGKRFSARDYADEAAKEICRELEEKQKISEVQTLYQEAIKFACDRHQEKNQLVKGSKRPYVVHLSNVAMELFMAEKHSTKFDLLYAIPVALLHDTLEDTDITFDELREQFGEKTARAVLALSKDKELPKEEQLADSLEKIKKLPKEIWAVKLADRITNLQPAPEDWSKEDRLKYANDAQVILDELGEGNDYLARRLEAKIQEYRNINKEFLLDGW